MIIDLSDVIDTKTKLKNTDRYSCWFDNESIYEVMQNFKKTNLFYKIIIDEKRREVNRVCLLNTEADKYNLLEKIKIMKTFFMM